MFKKLILVLTLLGLFFMMASFSATALTPAAAVLSSTDSTEGFRPVKYYLVDRVINNSDFSKLHDWGINSAVVDFDVNGSSSEWRSVFTEAAKVGISIVIWPSDWNNPRPNCGWEAPYPVSTNGDITKVKPLLDVASQYTNFIGIINAHESFWTCSMSFDEMAGLKDQLKAYALSKGRGIKVFNYIDNLYDTSMLPDNQISRIMDVAVTWQHCAGNAESTCDSPSDSNSALANILNDRKRINDAGLNGIVDLVYIVQTFTMSGYSTKFTLSELQNYSCEFLNTGGLDGFGFYTWDAGWWPDLHSWPDLQPAVPNIYQNCLGGSLSPTITPEASTFNFASMGDGQAEAANFTATSNQIATLHPDLVIFNGDLEDNGVVSSEMNPMTAALKKAGIFNSTFLIRGNHDDHVIGSASLWESYFEAVPNVKTLPAGVTDYMSLNSSSDYLNYSFIYGNAMFIGLDVPGDVDLLTSAELSFLDGRLAYAEGKGLTHAFIFFHGPLYCVESTHCNCSAKSDASCTPSALVSVINKHPIVSATFHGHEHVLGWVHMDKSRVAGLTGSFEEFITSPAGGWTYNDYLYPARMDYTYMDMGTSQGFGTVSVNGNQFTFCIYKVGTTAPVWCQTFTNGTPPPTSTPTVTNPPSVPVLVSPLTNVLTINHRPRLDWRDSTVPAGTTFQKYELQLAPDSGFTSPTSVDIAGLATNSEYTPTTDLNPNTKFYWRVRSYNMVGKYSSWSLVRTFRTALLPPTLTTPLDAENLLNNRPTFTWSVVSGATGYVIQISRNNLFKQLLSTTSVVSATYTPATNLPANMILFWRVQSRGTNGPSAWSAVRTVTTANPPSVPLLVSPPNNALTTNYTPLLDWAVVTIPLSTTFHHYQVQVADNAAFTSQVINDNSLTSITAHQFTPTTDLNPNTKYYWRVRSSNSVGQYSSWSLVRTFRTALLPPTLTTPLDAENLLYNRPTFDWNDVPGATGSILQVSKNSIFTQLAGTYSVTPSTYTPTTNLPANMILFWRVQSRGTNGPSAWSAVRTVTTANPPSVPLLVSPPNNALTTDYTPLLDWAVVTIPLSTTFHHYQVQIADNAAFTSQMIDDNSLTSITAHQFTPTTDLNPNTKYYWRVRSSNTDGEYSAWSLVRTFRTAISPPTLVAPADNARTNNRNPIFDWIDVAGVSSYTIQVSTNSSFTTLTVNATVVPSTYTPTINLPVGTLYWRARANGVNGPSLWSVRRSLIEQ
jgi:hypothetical protein